MIRTDHASLKWLLNPEGQVARWIEKLQQYDFSIQHIGLEEIRKMQMFFLGDHARKIVNPAAK